MPDRDSALRPTARASLPGVPRWLVRVGLPAIVAMVLVIAGSWVLDDLYAEHPGPRLLLAIMALTVDVLWGYSGMLTFGQSAFFGIGAYALAIVFTQFGFGPGKRRWRSRPRWYWLLPWQALSAGCRSIRAPRRSMLR